MRFQAIIIEVGLFIVLITMSGCGKGEVVDSSMLSEGIESNYPLVDSNPVHATTNSEGDSDRDGLPDELELQIGTDPQSIDTDRDGLSDHYELWGWQGVAVGNTGSMSGLSDPNGNGLIASLDIADMAGEVLKQASAIIGLERVPVGLPDEENFLPNDLDGDGIPNDFELNGFYVEFDSQYEPWFVKWDGEDFTKKYYKTDPTKWSTDGDPFSDWEEATKFNLDQRVKAPGDHPNIPAYPNLLLILDRYEVTLNQDVVIENSQGKQTQQSWTNTTEVTISKETVDTLEKGYGGYGNSSIPPFELLKKGPNGKPTGFEVAAGFQFRYNKIENTNVLNKTVVKDNTSGLTAREWSTARTVSGDSRAAAFLNLNLLMTNTGTLPADNVRAVCNLRLGDFVIESFLAGNGENGELQGRMGNFIPLQVSTTGRATPELPTGAPLTLTMSQLRSIQAGAPLSIEVVGFEADTVVWEIDPDTGRRTFLTTGDWSAYHNAIRNVSARLVLDFGDDPTFPVDNVKGVPVKRIDDVRIACFPLDGSYIGSPPAIDLQDAFIWAFEAEVVGGNDIQATIRDPASGRKHVSSLFNWEFGFDRQTVDMILADPQRFENLFLIPIEPGNPAERVYSCTAPPNGALDTPQIYWALCNPQTKLVRAYSRDVRGISEMRFKPDDGDEYDGEKMEVMYDPNDPELSFSYTYRLPDQYEWTGFEQVVAINADGKKTRLNVRLESDILGNQILASSDPNQSAIEITSWPGWPAAMSMKIGFDESGRRDSLEQLRFVQELEDDDRLRIRVQEWKSDFSSGKAGYIGRVHDLDSLDYNLLRKLDTSPENDTVRIAADTNNGPIPYVVFGFKTSEGLKGFLVMELVPEPFDDGNNVTLNRYEVDRIHWQLYKGI